MRRFLASKVALLTVAGTALAVACSTPAATPGGDDGATPATGAANGTGNTGNGPGSGGTPAAGGTTGGVGTGGSTPTAGSGVVAGSAGIGSGTGGDTAVGGSGGLATGGTSSGAAAGAGGTGTAGDGMVGTSGDGLNVGGKCFPVCGFPDITDPEPTTGVTDGYGWEGLQACVVAGSAAAMTATPCPAPVYPDPPAPGDGVQVSDGSCNPLCASSITDPDADGVSDGWGYENQHSCVVAGTAAALGGLPCDPMLPPRGTGDGIELPDDAGTLVCHPLCQDLVGAAPDANGWGWENDATCIVSASVAAAQGIPCDAPDPPPPPPPPPAPPGNDWNSDYTATMFGHDDCAPLGFSDSTNLNHSTCVGSGKLQLNGDNDTWFGAAGDLSTLWNGAPACTCSNGSSGVCSSPPGCGGQTDCGQCVEVVCNGTGTYSYKGDGFDHDEFCKPNTSVIVQLIDACPHNHPNNTYWCTTERKNHVDISCSAFNEIVQGRPVGDIGFVNVYARPVPCSNGLGPHTF